MIHYLAIHQHTASGHLIDSRVTSFHFPGGEVHIQIHEAAPHHQVAFCQFESDSDIVELAMWADAMHRQNRKTLLLLPYLPGARMDRGVPLGAKVYADLINAMGIDKVVTVDPHSDVAPALYDRLSIMPLTRIVPPRVVAGIIAPDAGAGKRAESIGQLLAAPVFYAGKTRDFKTGKLSGFKCEELPTHDLEGGVPKFLIVDDICDGGGTFMGLAQHLTDTQGIARAQMSLWVTHGIFSNGAVEKLDGYFSWIGTTNSHIGSARLDVSPKVVTRTVSIVKPLVQFSAEGN